MRFCEQHRAGDALRLELKEAVADDRESGFVYGLATHVPQRARLRQQRFVGRATVPLAQQMDSFHRVTLQELLPLGRLPDPGATSAYVLCLTNRARLPLRSSVFSIPLPRMRAKKSNVKLWHNGW